MADLSNKESKTINKSIEKQSDSEKQKADLMKEWQQLVKQESDLNLNLTALQKDLHLQRLKNLRDLSDKLKDDVWKYPTVQTLLGL